MQAGRKQYEDRMALPVPKVTIPKIAPAKGDSTKIDWSKAVSLDQWFKHGSNDAAARKLRGQMDPGRRVPICAA